MPGRNYHRDRNGVAADCPSQRPRNLTHPTPTAAVSPPLTQLRRRTRWQHTPTTPEHDQPSRADDDRPRRSTTPTRTNHGHYPRHGCGDPPARAVDRQGHGTHRPHAVARRGHRPARAGRAGAHRAGRHRADVGGVSRRRRTRGPSRSRQAGHQATSRWTPAGRADSRGRGDWRHPAVLRPGHALRRAGG